MRLPIEVTGPRAGTLRRRLAAVLLLAASAAPSLAAPVGVAVSNASTPTLCAETDNVSLMLDSPSVRRFAIEARHPAYMGTLSLDRTAPDFTACDMTKDPAVPAAAPRRVTLYESTDLWLTGFVFPSFWRPADVRFRVGESVTEGLHLVQLWVWHKERAEEVLVVYPPDGYWRARPLPPAHLRSVGYGSSFLVGPVETDGRPVVKLTEIAFAPQTRTFTLRFAGGGTARLALKALDEEKIALEATLDSAVRGQPFAGMRSMYVTEGNADVARVAWRAAAAPGWMEAPVMDFPGATDVHALWAGRLLPSRHNTSAPDMVFDRFEGP